MSFLQRLFSVFRRDPAPTPVANAHIPSPPSPAAPPVVQRPTVAVSWQEMLDASVGIAAYLLRPSLLTAQGVVSGADWLAALRHESFSRLVQRRRMLVPIKPAQWRAAEFRALIGPNVVFLLAGAAADGSENAEWAALAAEIRAAGGQLACDSATLAVLAGTDFPDLLLLDMAGRELLAFEQQLRGLRAQWPRLELAVEGVSSWAEYRFLIAQGVRYCQGPFATCRDEAQQGDGLSQNRLIILEMLKLLRGEADVGAIVAVAKRDPAIVVRLLEMANSPMTGLSRPVAALEDALLLLGRESLYRWLSLTLFQLGERDDKRDHTLMVIALSRAAFLESLAASSDKQQAGELFLVGMFSLIDSLLGLPADRVVHKMHLPETVSRVLLTSDGPYARYLMLAICMERGRIDQAVMLAAALGLDPATVVVAYGTAMAWATGDLL